MEDTNNILSVLDGYVSDNEDNVSRQLADFTEKPDMFGNGIGLHCRDKKHFCTAEIFHIGKTDANPQKQK